MAIPANLPLCEDPIILTVDSIDAQFPEYPDIATPPYCMCLPETGDCPGGASRCVGPPSGDDEDYSEKWKTSISGDSPSFKLHMVQLNEDCCNPEWEFQADLVTPCTPLACTSEVEVDSDYGTTSLEVTRVSQTEEEWAAGFEADNGRPPDPGAGEEYDPNDACRLEFKLTVPPRPALGFKVTHSGPGITYVNKCDCASSQEGLKLTATWEWVAALNSYQIVLDAYIDFEIPLIGKLTYNDSSVDTTIPLPTDSDPGGKILGPPEV